MKAKKSKGDGVFNKRNGLVLGTGSMKDVSSTNSRKLSPKMQSKKNVGDSSAGSLVRPDIFMDGHRKLSGSLMADIQAEQKEMPNVMGENKSAKKSSMDYTMQPKGKGKAKR